MPLDVDYVYKRKFNLKWGRVTMSQSSRLFLRSKLLDFTRRFQSGTFKYASLWSRKRPHVDNEVVLEPRSPKDANAFTDSGNPDPYAQSSSSSSSMSTSSSSS
jgi:hypothetical protein